MSGMCSLTTSYLSTKKIRLALEQLCTKRKGDKTTSPPSTQLLVEAAGLMGLLPAENLPETAHCLNPSKKSHQQAYKILQQNMTSDQILH